MNPGTHIVVLTRNWEFHIVDDICVAARNRRTGVPVAFHEAHGGRVLGSARVSEENWHWQISSSLRLGEHLAVEGTRGRFHSAPILAIETYTRADGYRLLMNMQAPAAAASDASHSARSVLRELWTRMFAPAPAARATGAAA